MSKPSPAPYRITNWSSHTASLRRRGPLLLWLDKDMACLTIEVGFWLLATGPSDSGERRKLRLVMDTATSDIRAVEVTPGSDRDSAGDTRRWHTALLDRQEDATLQIRKRPRPPDYRNPHHSHALSNTWCSPAH